MQNIFGVFLFSLLLLGCGKGSSLGKKEFIEGTVQNIYGQPIEGATVSIENSQFNATTNQSGKYSLDYVPGEFTVVVQAEGFQSEKFSLNIAQKLHYPANPTSLIPKIPDQTLVFVDKPNATLRTLVGRRAHTKRLWHSDGFEDAYFVDHKSTDILPTVKAGVVSFLDTTSGKNTLYLFKLQFQTKYYSVGTSDSQRYTDGAVKSDVTMHGNIKFHKFELQPGFYAWVIAKPDYKGVIRPTDFKEQNILAFIVE